MNKVILFLTVFAMNEFAFATPTCTGVFAYSNAEHACVCSAPTGNYYCDQKNKTANPIPCPYGQVVNSFKTGCNPIIKNTATNNSKTTTTPPKTNTLSFGKVGK